MSSLTDDQKGLLYMFEKPYEPLFIPRASTSFVYNLPTDDLPEGVVASRIGTVGATSVNVIRVTTIEQMPQSVRSIPRGEPFSIFISSHRRAARDLITLFMGTTGLEGMRNFAANIRDSVNETLFVYCFSYVLIRKPDLRNVRLPAIFEIFPSRFVPAATLGQAKDNVGLVQFMESPLERVVVEHDLDFTGTDLNLEHRVAYWREDYGINSHHWHWHLVYPLNMGVNRDRKGEMFYFMHSQMLARYDMERLSNGIPRVKILSNWREPINEGYFSKLTINNARIPWGSRQDNTMLRDVERSDPMIEPFSLAELETWRERLLAGIHKGFFTDRGGRRIDLSDNVDILTGAKRGIDVLGDTFEADSELSPNFPFYGDLHNFGHVAIAFCHDPDGSHKEQIGVLGDPGTAMRDPVFYRWHKFIDYVFQTYKLTQPPYTDAEILVPNVRVEKFGVSSDKEGNVIRTFFDMKLIEASRGLDFGATTPTFVNLTRLNHKPFTYQILVTNSGPAEKRVTVRIFLAPKRNESGRDMSYTEQRTLWVEMDKFDFLLKTGANHIKKDSTSSSITIPEELTFRDLEQGQTAEQLEEAFCGCGWPQHMLVPRGRPEGMPFELFVLLSDFELDKVEGKNGGKGRCKNAVSYCGILDARFPDRRPMGYPFDRRPTPDITTVQEFVKKFPNSNKLEISIIFTNRMNG